MELALWAIKGAGAVTMHLCPSLAPCMQVHRAVKSLLRIVIQGKLAKEWKAREYFVRPAQQRVLDAKETRRRLARKRFKSMMAAITARQARYVQCSVVHAGHAPPV